MLNPGPHADFPPFTRSPAAGVFSQPEAENETQLVSFSF